MRLLLVLFSLLAVYSCKHDPVFGDSPSGPLNPCAGGEISFNAQVLPILNRSCNTAGCHLDAIYNGASFTTYASIFSTGSVIPGDTAISALYQRLVSTDPAIMMPPPDSARLSLSEQDVIAGWILQNAPNNDCTP